MREPAGGKKICKWWKWLNENVMKVTQRNRAADVTSHHASHLLRHLIFHALNFVWVNVLIPLGLRVWMQHGILKRGPLFVRSTFCSGLRLASVEAPERNTGARRGEQGGRGRREGGGGRSRKSMKSIAVLDWRTVSISSSLACEGPTGSAGERRCSELGMENQEQFLCGVVEGKRGRLETWPPVRSHDWACVVLFLRHRLTQIWALFTCWHAAGEGLRGSGDRCVNLPLEGCGSLYEVMLISQTWSGG